MVLSRKNPSTPPTNIEVSRRTCIDIIMAYDWQLNAFHNSNWCPNIIADSSEGYLQYLINLGNCGDDESWVFLHPLGQHLKMGSLLLVQQSSEVAQKKTRLGALRKKKLTREKKIEKPSTKRFRVEFKSTNCRFDNPTWKLLLRYCILLASYQT